MVPPLPPVEVGGWFGCSYPRVSIRLPKYSRWFTYGFPWVVSPSSLWCSAHECHDRTGVDSSTRQQTHNHSSFWSHRHAPSTNPGANLQGGLRNAGVVDVIAGWLSPLIDHPQLHLAALTMTCGFCSAFMNNVGALAMFISDMATVFLFA